MHSKGSLNFELATEFRAELIERLCIQYSKPEVAASIADLKDWCLCKVFQEVGIDRSLMMILPPSGQDFDFDYITIGSLAYPALGIVYADSVLLLHEENYSVREKFFTAVNKILGFRHIVILGLEGMFLARFDDESWIVEKISKEIT